MSPVVFTLFSSQSIVQALKKCPEFEIGVFDIHHFPDEEINIKIHSEIANRKTAIICSLDRPNDKLATLLFMGETLKDLGAAEVGLILPYLPYMRQDKRFSPGESITSVYFAKLLSNSFDWLITVDPHLHRRRSLNEIYSIPSTVLNANEKIAFWIKNNIPNPLIIGPDEESLQWVASIAETIKAPYVVANKVRKGDAVVEVEVPRLEQYSHGTLVLADDIISTGQTMTKTIVYLKSMGFHEIICVGTHAIFSGSAYEDLFMAGASKVVSCNTIEHGSNAVDLNDMIIRAIKTNFNGAV